ncbi:MAG TPA: DNA cytosine methyltransferase [Candidatus Acidoferrales bacterium]|jgi:DNA (cytosine-5)-methyltransferase 1|nr:DNA cytosine methyltransferase [Candidatus Acidoferrales bacterium]
MASFYEFFAGGGMARAGLGEEWSCLFANDIDAKKGASYAANWGSEQLKIGDVSSLKTKDLPGAANLAWASFPCQDLSLAGAGAGLDGERSGTFWPFWRLVQKLGKEGRAPSLVVLENVCGALASHGGKDFAAIGAAISGSKYRFGALVIDAVRFVPQSRPRLFFICVDENVSVPDCLMVKEPVPLWQPPHLLSAYNKLSTRSKAAWLWWHLPEPPMREVTFSDLIEDEPQGVSWHTSEETKYLLSLMSPINRRKVKLAKRMGRRMVGGVYKRTRRDENGERMQRAEVRFDDISGCLRTPVGGSSRQSIIIVDGDRVRSRLLSPREAARLMGLPDSYKLPQKYNEAYHLAGDGVVVPVVRFLAANLLGPILSAAESHKMEAA